MTISPKAAAKGLELLKSQAAAMSSWQPPSHEPSHWRFGAWPRQVSIPSAWHIAWASALMSHLPSHLTSTEPGLASTSHSAAAFAAMSSEASQRAGSKKKKNPKPA